MPESVHPVVLASVDLNCREEQVQNESAGVEAVVKKVRSSLAPREVWMSLRAI